MRTEPRDPKCPRCGKATVALLDPATRRETARSECVACGHVFVSVPYEYFCLDPMVCRGYGSCPRDYACSE